MTGADETELACAVTAKQITIDNAVANEFAIDRAHALAIEVATGDAFEQMWSLVHLHPLGENPLASGT